MTPAFEALARRVDDIIVRDRSYFKNNQWRRHRIRRATLAEIQLNERVVGADSTIHRGKSHFVVIRNEGNWQTRVFFVDAADRNINMPEEVVSNLFDRLVLTNGRVEDFVGGVAT